MTTTRSAPWTSDARIGRPRRIGVPSAEEWPSLTNRLLTLRPSPGEVPEPSATTPPYRTSVSASGAPTLSDTAADLTPGTLRTSCSASRQRSGVHPSCRMEGESCTVQSPSSRMPASRAISRWELLARRAAPMRSTSAVAASSVISTRCRRPRRAVRVAPLAPSFSLVTRSPRDACQAGMLPATRPTVSDTAQANSATVPSTSIVSARGNPLGSIVEISRTDGHAMARPSAPPGTPSSVDSTTSWRANWTRLAPSAARILISWSRAPLRASCRLRRLPTPISRTHETAPRRTQSRRLTSPAM
jgi:hypothetical protein